MKVTEKIFQVAISIFSFHVKMFFLTRGSRGQALSNDKIKIERSNENPQWCMNMAFWQKKTPLASAGMSTGAEKPEKSHHTYYHFNAS